MDYGDFAAAIKLKYMKEEGEHATFVPNKKLPIYNWFYYKEGFSKDLVFSLIEKFQLNESSVVLDPFAGSGTTLLACKQKGMSAIGFDVLPISLFAARVKTSDYEPQELKDVGKKLLKAKFRRINYEYPPLMRKSFSRFVLEDISVFRAAIMDMESKKLRDFFLLALINAAMRCSYAWKDGGVIKIKKRGLPPLRVMLRRVIYNMIRDIEHFDRSETSSKIQNALHSESFEHRDAEHSDDSEIKNAETITELCDARRMKLSDESVDAVITSPPYLNNIDYTKVYQIEQFILHEREEPGLRSYIGYEKEVENNVLPEMALPPAAVAYFTDMLLVLKEMRRVTKKNGEMAIIVGNAYIDGQIIDSDTILAYMAEQIGLKTEEIIVLNERFALENRTEKKGILRESMIVLKKLA